MPPSFAAASASLADAGVAVRGHDQVGTLGDLPGHHEPGLGLHHRLDPGGLGGCRQAVVGIGHHDPDNVDPMLAQHVEGGHAEMARADEGNPHGGSVRPGSRGLSAGYLARR